MYSSLEPELESYFPCPSASRIKADSTMPFIIYTCMHWWCCFCLQIPFIEWQEEKKNNDAILSDTFYSFCNLLFTNNKYTMEAIVFRVFHSHFRLDYYQRLRNRTAWYYKCHSKSKLVWHSFICQPILRASSIGIGSSHRAKKYEILCRSFSCASYRIPRNSNVLNFNYIWNWELWTNLALH